MHSLQQPQHVASCSRPFSTAPAPAPAAARRQPRAGQPGGAHALAAASPRPQPQRRSTPCARAVGDFFKDFLDFNSWAPKSTRIWRLQQWEPSEADAERRGGSASDDGPSDSLDVLQARINQLRDSPSPPPSSSSSARGSTATLDGDEGDASSGSSSSSFDGGSAGAAADDDGGRVDASGSFSDADDADVSAALSKRIRQIATTTGEWGSSMDEEEMRQPLTGQEVRQLLLSKYGKQYDVSFVRRNLPGMGPCVSLNIMWLHLDQASFKMSPAQYMDKLDSVAQLVNVLGQTDKVRAFLRAPARSMKGLPRRPVVGTAISIRMDLSREQISEWFGQGYD